MNRESMIEYIITELDYELDFLESLSQEDLVINYNYATTIAEYGMSDEMNLYIDDDDNMVFGD